MSTRIQAPKGVQEYVPPESGEFVAVRDGLLRPARMAGYDYIELPTFEDYSLFARGVGESTDVVSKEMYTFTDRGDRKLALRPEGTAGVMRAVIQHGLYNGPLPVKLRYAGPFYRAERPQKGRYRQFHQVGIEAIGSEDPFVDAEVVAIAHEAFRTVGLREFELQMTSLGCARCRPAYRELLTAYLADLDLDDATRERAVLNPLRVLDDKRESVQAQLGDAPLMVDHLCAECRRHYDEVRQLLGSMGVRWTETPRLVRGLDYYTRTTFEFVHPRLGAQSGIGGGGRYDGLMESIGGPPMSGIGFGLGTDRTLLAREAENLPTLAPARIDVFGIALGDAARERMAAEVVRLRAAGIATDVAFGGRGLKGAMKSAARSGARWVMIIGDDEVARRTVQVKDLRSGEQVEVESGTVDRHIERHQKGMSDAEDA